MLEMLLAPPPPSAPPAIDKWSQLASSALPQRSSHAGAVVAGKFFVTGGVNPANAFGLVDTAMYDPASNTWAVKAPMPEGRRNHTCVAIGTKVYVFGGSATNQPPTSRALFIYDSLTDTWTTSNALGPGARNSHAACASDDGKMYIFSGAQAYTNDLWVYDPVLDTWTQKASGSTIRPGSKIACLDGVLYVFGGHYIESVYPNTLWKYTIASDTWVEILTTTKPQGRKDQVFAGIDGKLYMGQGSTSSNGWLNEMWVYDPTTNLWAARKPLPTARYLMAVGVLGRKIFVHDGIGQNAVTTPLSLWQYEI